LYAESFGLLRIDLQSDELLIDGGLELLEEYAKCLDVRVTGWKPVENTGFNADLKGADAE